ncbi:hypothetical protein [Nitrosomonas aestuarii]|uniref:Uncharacterized protein n=1 Tax=Nitrosomonas aestuarii TaxID=52441 RepID=A0A1I4BHD6_9PROT|nr:hypothetical protein [Nitrosomonas aestuarii]PTN11501.1 hypothetical protein C8R11_10944 [Nitrosomonas aestuarii]SFK68282.1 hypothetical protein SAMN05216302_101239 [Nitrosomonas aestuarii]
MALKKLIKEFNTYLGEKESLLDTDYQHVAQKIELHWGYDEFYPFIEKLLVDTRDRKRTGFPIEAMLEISELHRIHEQLYPPKTKSR